MATIKTVLRSTGQEVFAVGSICLPPQRFFCGEHEAERIFRPFLKGEGSRSKMKGEIMIVKKSNLTTVTIAHDMVKVAA